MAEPADELATYIVPDLTIKQLLDSIPYVIDLVNRDFDLKANSLQSPLLQAFRGQVVNVHVRVAFPLERT
jgi:hypothetical protein